MSIYGSDKAKRLLFCLGGIDDFFLEEAESLGIIPAASTRKRIVKYSALAAAASVSIAVTYWMIRSKKSSADAVIA